MMLNVRFSCLSAFGFVPSSCLGIQVFRAFDCHTRPQQLTAETVLAWLHFQYIKLASDCLSFVSLVFRLIFSFVFFFLFACWSLWCQDCVCLSVRSASLVQTSDEIPLDTMNTIYE